MNLYSNSKVDLFEVQLLPYFSELLKYREKGDIYEVLCRSVKETLEEVMLKVMTTNQHLAFAFFVDYLNSSKSNFKKEEMPQLVDIFLEKLKMYIQLGNKFSNNLIEKNIFNKSIFEEIGDGNSKNVLNRLYTKSEKFNKDFAKHLRDTLIKSILLIGNTLDKMGKLKFCNKISNDLCILNKLDFLKIDLGEEIEEDTIDEIMKSLNEFGSKKKEIYEPKTVREMFTTKYLSRLNLSTLVILQIYWANKFAKTCEAIFITLMALGNNKSILIGLEKGDISNFTLKYWLEDAKGEISREIMDVWCAWENDNEPSFATNSYLEKEKVEMVKPIYESIQISYISKKLSTYLALKQIPTTPFIKNYGIVPNESSSHSSMIPYIWDLPGFNLPVSIHIEKESLSFFYREIMHEDKIRVYAGAKDFFCEDRKWTNALLYPLNNEQISRLKTYHIKNCKIFHLAFIQTGIWPSHMRDKNNRPKKKYIEIRKL